MKFHSQQAVRAFILLTFSVMLFKQHYTGEILKFINPKYEGLSQTASVLFLFLFFIQITRIWTAKEHSHHHHCTHDDHGHDHGASPFTTKKLVTYLVIIFPLATGLFLPAKVLDASIVDKKGGMAVLSNQKKSSAGNNNRNNGKDEPALDHTDTGSGSPQEMTKEEYEQLIQELGDSPKIKLNDDVYAAYYDEIHTDIDKYKGREIDLKGFVYKEEGFEQNQLVIARFLITHCVADSSIIGFFLELPEASTLTENTWIEAKGVLDRTTFNGIELPIITITKWKEIKQPKQPYLYPINVRIL